jgi:ribosomal protein S18 acetylase RimI-like enzyme
MFELEPGQPGDADAAGRLIAATDADLFRYLTGGSLDAWTAIAAREWRAERGIYGYTMADVARRGGELLGVAVSYHSRRLAEFDWTLGASLPHSPADVAACVRERFPVAAFLFPTVPPDAWYLQNIAVASAFRGAGLGRVLVDAARARGRAAGCRSLHLDVDSSVPAVRFYERLGFEVLVETRVPRIPGVHTHYRMILPLAAS